VFAGDGWYLRRWICGGCMLLHGLRMALAAWVVFYPWHWPEDLPRYKYAKVRFMTKDGMPERLWPVKVQHDTLQQWYSNATTLACPMVLVAFNKTERFHVLEIVGIALWVGAWIWENVADVQKAKFMTEAKRMNQGRTAVLGYEPYDGKAYSLWSACRHPNYFGEWTAWNGFIVMGIPSLIELNEPLWIKIGYGVALFMLSRIFYDCLNFWTGAEPAEHYSVQKRAVYKDYQRKTRMFWPFEMPFFNHYREPGWPNNDESHELAIAQ